MSGSTYGNNNAGLQICNLKYEWKRAYENVILTAEGVKADDIVTPVCIILTSTNLHVIETNNCKQIWYFNLQTHEFSESSDDPTLICVQRPVISYRVSLVLALTEISTGVGVIVIFLFWDRLRKISRRLGFSSLSVKRISAST